MHTILVTLEPSAGTAIEDMIALALAEVRCINSAEKSALELLGAEKVVEFKQNGIVVRVAHDSKAGVLAKLWGSALQARKDDHLMVVGPYPK